MNAVEALARTAEHEGPVDLPLLTQADLCALGAAHHSLICKRTWTWWTSLAPRQRELAAARSLEVLALRRLIAPTAGTIPAVPTPELGVILAARARPQVIVTCQVPDQDAAFEPRFFGVTSQEGGLRALVRETLTPDAPGTGNRADFGTVLRYTLMTPYDAADAMTTWARSRGMMTTIDVFSHRSDGHPARDHIEIRPADDLHDVHRPAGGIPPGRLDNMELRQFLASALTGDAQ